jgi:hypothetical protein
MLSSDDDQETGEIHLQLVRVLGVPHTANLPESAPGPLQDDYFEGFMKTILMTACFYLVFTAAPMAQMQSGQRLDQQARTPTANTCTIVADYGPLWLWVFEEFEGNGGGGLLLYDGKLERGGKKVITSGTDRVRYFFKTDGDQDMHGNVVAWCYKGNTISVA